MRLASCNYKLSQENVFVLCQEYKLGTSISTLQEDFRISRTSVVYHLKRAGLYTVNHKAKVGRK